MITLKIALTLLLLKFIIAALLWLANEMTDGWLWREVRSLFPAPLPQ